MDEFLRYLITEIVTNTDDLNIVKTEEPDAVVYTISLHSDDYGKIIGKSGKTINAIRMLLNVYNHNKESTAARKIILKVDEA